MTDGSVYFKGHVESITTTWLQDVQAGDQAAWRKLVDVYLPLIYRWCKLKQLQDADVRNVAQNVLLAVAKGLSRFRRERPDDTFRGWLRTITRNELHNHFRRAPREPALPVDVPDVTLDDSAQAQNEELQILCCRLLDRVRNQCSEQDWQAFVRTVVENQAAAEVAAALGITRNQVYLAVSRLKKRLREEYGEIPGIQAS